MPRPALVRSGVPPPRAFRARTIRAIRFASATRPGIAGLRAGISAGHLPGRAAAWTCRLMMTLSVPMTGNRRRDRSPVFAVARHRHQSPGHVILTGPTGDPGIEPADPRRQTGERRDRNRSRDSAARQPAGKLRHRRPPQPVAQRRPASAVGAMHLKHGLRRIEPDRDNL